MGLGREGMVHCGRANRGRLLRERVRLSRDLGRRFAWVAVIGSPYCGKRRNRPVVVGKRGGARRDVERCGRGNWRQRRCGQLDDCFFVSRSLQRYRRELDIWRPASMRHPGRLPSGNGRRLPRKHMRRRDLRRLLRCCGNADRDADGWGLQDRDL